MRAQERDRLKAERVHQQDTVRKLEKEIMQLEEEQEKVNAELANPHSYNDPEKARDLNLQASRLAKQLEERNYEWEIEAEKLLELDEKKALATADA